MRFNINARALGEAVSLCTMVADRKSPQAMLKYVLLLGDGTNVRVAASDGYGDVLVLEVPCDAKVDVCVDAKLLGDALTHLSGDAEIVVNDKTLRISDGTSTFTLAKIPGSEFPALPKAPPEFYDVDAGALIGAMKAVAFSASVDESRTKLNAVAAAWGKGCVRSWAFDDKRLSVATRDVDDGPTFVEFALRPVSVRRLAALVEGDDGVGVSAVNDARIAFKNKRGVLFSRVADGYMKDPDSFVNQLVPAASLECSRDELVAAVKTASLMAPNEGGSRAVTMVGAGDTLTVCADCMAGDSARKVKVGGKCPEFQATINAAFAMDALGAILAPTVTVEANDVAVMLRGPDSKHLVAQIRK